MGGCAVGRGRPDDVTSAINNFKDTVIDQGRHLASLKIKNVFFVLFSESGASQGRTDQQSDPPSDLH